MLTTRDLFWKGFFQLNDKFLAFLAVSSAHFTFSPGRRAILIRDVYYLVDRFIYLFLIGGGYLNSSFCKNVLHMPEIVLVHLQDSHVFGFLVLAGEERGVDLLAGAGRPHQ